MASVRSVLMTENDQVRLLLPAGGEDSLSKVDHLAGNLCLVVVLAVLLRRVDLGANHQVVVIAFLFSDRGLRVVHF